MIVDLLSLFTALASQLLFSDVFYYMDSFPQISSLVANNMARNWPHDLYEKVAQCL